VKFVSYVKTGSGDLGAERLAREEARVGAIVRDKLLLDLAAAAAQETNKPFFGTMLELIGAGKEAVELARELCARAESGEGSLEQSLHPLREVRLLSPIPRPRKNIFCVGLNYRSHVEQNAASLGIAADLPKVPLFFTKPVTAVAGPGQAILHDKRLTEKLDYEVELAVVIAKGGKWIPQEEALDHVFGYSLANDVSARDLQWLTSQFFYGKGQDSYCPFGPCIVDKESLPSLDEVVLELTVNGELRQSEPAGNMLFSVPYIVSYLSRGITLEPGDVISMGTPGGCGYQMSPPRFLWPGDVVQCRANGIGTLENPVVAAEEQMRVNEGGAHESRGPQDRHGEPSRRRRA
jgi:2-keto-4-pentenoate hydratase/2-oxohepta-3-ene-1,7-dioic acid hydratase in catechol pathway